MAVASSSSSSSAMNKSSEEESKNKEDEHEYDVVMPGFRFHPTEEELVEFYLRRKVEGKHFNVELITFLDLYRYDPWELPGLAAIGEKEWYFYVPRDRKYRNGDRPNRVTTSGYWKATGADRMIRTENQRSIGLKKTLVFYSGKAPKGIRTSWIMNEYRLPLHETQRLQKAEISLCRVYKRAGVEDYPSLPSSRISKPISQNQASMERFQSTTINNPKSITDQITSTSSTSNPSQPLPLSNHDSFNIINNPLIIPPHTSIFATTSSSHALDDLHNLVNNINYSQVQQVVHHDHQNPRNNNPINLVSSHFSTSLQPQTQPAGALSPFQAAFSDRLWDWNVISDQAGKDLTNLFK